MQCYSMICLDCPTDVSMTMRAFSVEVVDVKHDINKRASNKIEGESPAGARVRVVDYQSTRHC